MEWGPNAHNYHVVEDISTESACCSTVVGCAVVDTYDRTTFLGSFFLEKGSF